MLNPAGFEPDTADEASVGAWSPPRSLPRQCVNAPLSLRERGGGHEQIIQYGHVAADPDLIEVPTNRRLVRLLDHVPAPMPCAERSTPFDPRSISWLGNGTRHDE